VMAETKSRQLYAWNSRLGGGVRSVPELRLPLPDYAPLTLTSEVTTVTKQRRRASPLGFGVAYDGLSLKQKAILAALGLSKLSF